MSQTSAGTKLLLFLSTDIGLGRLAGSIFDEEAQKMDVVWNADAKTVPSGAAEDESASQSDVQNAGLVIVIQRPESKVNLKTIFPGWAGRAEFWDLPLSSDEAVALRQNVANLMVRLILEGGKRQPTAETTVSARPGTVPASSNTPMQKNDAVRVQRESKGRGGKTVTIVSGLTLENGGLEALAKQLKQLCGTGGTIKDGKIEIQGDQCDRILAELLKKGFKAKRAGG
jgi:predicted translation initiation factor SUI1